MTTATPTLPAPSPSLTISGPTASTITPKAAITPEMYEAARLRLVEGLSLEEIATRLGKARPTITQWLRRLSDEALAELEAQTPANLIVEKVQELRAIRDFALQKATAAKSERLAVAFTNAALRSLAQETELLLAAGLIPKVPEKLYTVNATLRPAVPMPLGPGESEPPKDRKVLIGELIEKLHSATPL